MVTANVENFNGWGNRETWAMALWISNEQGWDGDTVEMANEIIKPYFEAPNWLTGNSRYTWTFAELGSTQIRFETRTLANRMRDYMVECLTDPCDSESILPVLQDIGSLWRVRWEEIADHYIDSSIEHYKD